MPKLILFILVSIQLFVINCSSKSSEGAGIITLNPQVTYQTINGWETLYAGAEDIPVEDAAVAALVDRAVNDVGINRIQIQVRACAENDQDYWSMWWNKQIDTPTWRAHRYTNVNDNDDPDLINLNRFYFGELDYLIDRVALPMKQLLEARGEALYVNLLYVAFTGQNGPGTQYIHNNPDEYAEFMLVTFNHLQERYGWVPDALEIILEPDNVAQWNNGFTIGNAIVKTMAKLKANGYAPRINAPSNTNMTNAVTYFDQLVQVPGATQDVSELTYHRYAGVSETSLRAIADRGVRYGIHTAMTEWWDTGNSYRTLHQDLKMGRNSSWQQGVLGGYNRSKTGFFYVDVSNPSNPIVNIQEITKFTRQYMKFVRKGAVRIEATSDNSNLDPLAFINTNGKYVVVIKAEGADNFTIQGLPAGTYGIKYTTANQYNVDQADVSIGKGQPVSGSIPGVGVITVYAKSTTVPVEEVNIGPPQELALIQNYPNPFNASTTIEYTLSKMSRVKLTIMDLVGKEIATVVNNLQATGNYRVRWDAPSAGTGVYLLKLQTGESTQIRRMLLLK
jgi:O-glycosyl hydrolase